MQPGRQPRGNDPASKRPGTRGRAKEIVIPPGCHERGRRFRISRRQAIDRSRILLYTPFLAAMHKNEIFPYRMIMPGPGLAL